MSGTDHLCGFSVNSLAAMVMEQIKQAGKAKFSDHESQYAYESGAKTSLVIGIVAASTEGTLKSFLISELNRFNNIVTVAEAFKNGN